MDSYVISHELDHGIIAGNTGKNPFRISSLEIGYAQVGGNDRCLFIHDTLVDTAEKLRGYKAVGQFRPQIINDEQITVIDKRSHIRGLDVFFEGISRQKVEKVKGTEIQNKIRTVQKFLCDTVGKVGLSYTSISINHKIIEGFPKTLDKCPGLVISVMGGFQGGDAASRVCKIRGIILKREIADSQCDLTNLRAAGKMK